MCHMMKWVLGWTLLLASALPGQAADPAHPGLKTQLKKPPALQSATPIPVPKPDLAITSMAWSYPIREGDKIGMSSILNLLIANRGGVETPPTTVRFVCTGGCPAVLTGSRPVPMIPAGQNLGINWPDGLLATWPSGTFTLEAVVDPSGQVADSNRSNNRKKIVFTVVPSPPALHKKNVGGIQPASVAAREFISTATVIKIEGNKISLKDDQGRISTVMNDPAGIRIGETVRLQNGRIVGSTSIKPGELNPGKAVGINPQPEPPGKNQ